MRLLTACLILKQVEEGKFVYPSLVNEARKRVAVAQAEFIALKAQIKN